MSGLPDLDRMIHEPARLGIVSLLASRREASFLELKELLDMTDGNLSVHLRTLEEAGYVSVVKSFEGRRPKTSARLTRKGVAAFDRYIDVLESVVRPRKVP